MAAASRSSCPAADRCGSRGRTDTPSDALEPYREFPDSAALPHSDAAQSDRRPIFLGSKAAIDEAVSALERIQQPGRTDSRPARRARAMHRRARCDVSHAQAARARRSYDGAGICRSVRAGARPRAVVRERDRGQAPRQVSRRGHHAVRRIAPARRRAAGSRRAWRCPRSAIGARSRWSTAIRPSDGGRARPIRRRWRLPGSGTRSSRAAAIAGVVEVIRSGKPQLHAEISDEMLAAAASSDEELELYRHSDCARRWSSR